MTEKQYPEAAGKGIIIAGWIFSILGGLIGLAIGFSLWKGTIKDASGNKVPRYNEAAQNQGKMMAAVAIVVIILVNVLRTF